MKPELLLFLLLPWFSSAGCTQQGEPSLKRQPNLFLIPNGYIGWLHVEYEVKGAPALPVWKGFRLYKFSRKGIIRTSSPLLFGWAKDKMYFTTPKSWKEVSETVNQGKGMIWGRNLGMGGVTVGNGKGNMRKIPTPPTEDVFIGTWKQFYHRKTEPPRSKEEKAALTADY